MKCGNNFTYVYVPKVEVSTENVGSQVPIIVTGGAVC